MLFFYVFLLFLYYMLVLFPLSGGSYCAVYLFIVLIDAIFKLNGFFYYYVLVSLQLPVQVILFTV